MICHQGTITLETRRLLLRRALPEDAQPMFDNWASDPEVTKYLTWPPHSSPEVTAQVLGSWIAEYEKQDFYQWMIVLKELGQPIGSISVVEQNESAQWAEIGYCMGKPWWGQGIMTEALTVVMDYLFDQVGMNRLQAQHDPNNPASGTVMKKCGMKHEGTLRQYGRNNQGICDICIYSQLKEERNKL